MIIPILIIGLASSIATEIFKVLPGLSKTKERKRIVAFLVSLIVAAIYLFSIEAVDATTALTFGGSVLAATFVIYKAVVQPIEAIVVAGKNFIAKSQV